jgi:hypothetical protein
MRCTLSGNELVVGQWTFSRIHGGWQLWGHRTYLIREDFQVPALVQKLRMHLLLLEQDSGISAGAPLNPWALAGAEGAFALDYFGENFDFNIFPIALSQKEVCCSTYFVERGRTLPKNRTDLVSQRERDTNGWDSLAL